MLEAAAHCDVLLPPEFVIELHSAGLMQSSCPAPAAPPRYCWSGLSGLYSAIYGLEFDMFAQLLTFDPRSHSRPRRCIRELLEEFLQIDTSFMIARRRYFIMPLVCIL